ncbi:ATP-dependent zinc metalloprotease FtsH [Corynebacterium provencense]|uniref:ATP-dependent zinc metalloprotease FtsH n=1 Tax=Corynebacterium provencense TaxID=1737425 RepID=A0A2Z3YQ58_9CORY|nr:ATP-dependent zinc metalloprotease FtsH [Corynebacterium provencense]AWT27012.1 ATP-dependent zinc metalloprotease FtsH [Corynebacterium provencense]
MTKKKVLRIAAVIAAVLVAIYAFSVLTDSTRGYSDVDTSVAVRQLDDKNVSEVQINDREQQLQITLKNKISVDGDDDVEKIITQYPARAADTIFDKVQASGADKYQTKVTEDSLLGSLLVMLLPVLLIGGLLLFFLTRMQGGGAGGPFGIGKSRAKELNVDNPDTTFDDVAGADEAVEELDEIRDFLQNPGRYEQLGAKVPRGVLLYGPPGTGKTLLARAVAGEAGVPFYSISGSDFVEMFVGVGASRVRDLFKTAKENSPCIIFVDEIDAVGRQRGAGMGGGHDEREQTLNQLLVEMDGFDDREGVILMAATNRPDILDPALLRPGRFDRQIPVGNPDLAGREQILRVHARNKPLAPDVDLKSLAKRTVGMSGADLENVLNEAALLTARVNGNVITADALEEATDRVIGGPRRTSKIISEQEKKVTAYHESGHTLAAWGIRDIERVYKVTILARGKTGGHAMAVPEDDKGMYTRSELFARLVFAMGGRSAEELVFGSPTTGASADIEQATKIARAMVTEYGMSPQLGAVKYGEEQGDPFAGRGGQGTLDYSPAVAATIDDQVRTLIEKAHVVAYRILRGHRDHLDTLASRLLEKETLRRPDLEAILGELDPVAVEDIFDGQDRDFPRDYREPVKTPTELARERGEEPPERPDFYSEARKARMERRKAEQEARRAGADQGQDSGEARRLPGFPPQEGTGTRRWDARSDPQEHRRAGHDHLWGGQDRVDPPGDPLDGRSGPPRHPGEVNYGPGDGAADGPVSPPLPPAGEMRGFRLPDNEQPDNPWTTDDAPTGRHSRTDSGGSGNPDAGNSSSNSGNSNSNSEDRDGQR